MADRVEHAPTGHFQDASRYRRALGEAEYESLRYFESAVEFWEDNVFPFKHKRHVHVLLSETHLHIFRPRKPEDRFFGDGASGGDISKTIKAFYPPIGLNSVVSVRSSPNAHAEKVFELDRLNYSSRMIELDFISHRKAKRKDGTPTEVSERFQTNLLAWEVGSRLCFHLQAAWTTVKIRIALRLPIAFELNCEGERRELYNDVIGELKHESTDILGRTELLHELAEAGLHDRTIKRFFFTVRKVPQFLLNELVRCHSTIEVGDARMLRLRYVVSILELMHSMLFNAQVISERHKLMQPSPFSYTGFLSILTFDFRLHAVRKHVKQDLERKGAPKDEDDESSGRTFPHLGAILSSPRALGLTAKAASRFLKGKVTVRKSMPDDERAASENAYAQRKRQDEIPDDSGSESEKGSDEDDQDAHELIQAINDIQVATLCELNGVAESAVQSKLKDLVPGTLAHSLAKVEGFARVRVPVYVARLVRLCRSWNHSAASPYDEDRDGESEDEDHDEIPALQKEQEPSNVLEKRSVLIYHHMKLLHFLILDSPRFREAVVEACEEEMVFYLFKKEFQDALTSRGSYLFIELSLEMLKEVQIILEEVIRARNAKPVVEL